MAGKFDKFFTSEKVSMLYFSEAEIVFLLDSFTYLCYTLLQKKLANYIFRE